MGFPQAARRFRKKKMVVDLDRLVVRRLSWIQNQSRSKAYTRDSRCVYFPCEKAAMEAFWDSHRTDDGSFGTMAPRDLYGTPAISSWIAAEQRGIHVAACQIQRLARVPVVP